MGAKSDQVKGQAKEVVGSVIGDKDLESEGKADRRDAFTLRRRRHHLRRRHADPDPDLDPPSPRHLIRICAAPRSRY